MSVVVFEDGDRFVLRVIKFLTTNPDNKWANSYEFRATESGSESLLETLGDALVSFEQALSHDVVSFDHLLISTWEADSKPYDPLVFASIPLTVNGTIGPVGDMLGLNNCLSLARVATSGRFGHIFIRGFLEEVQVHAPAGKTVLVDRPGIQSDVDDALSESGLDNYVGSTASGAFKMVMINKDGTQMRDVNSIRVQGVSAVPLDHAWFNRTTSP